MKRSTAALSSLLFGALLAPPGSQAQDGSWGITAVDGITVGNHTLSEKPTGCTVILAGQGAIGGVTCVAVPPAPWRPTFWIP